MHLQTPYCKANLRCDTFHGTLAISNHFVVCCVCLDVRGGDEGENKNNGKEKVREMLSRDQWFSERCGAV